MLTCTQNSTTLQIAYLALCHAKSGVDHQQAQETVLLENTMSLLVGMKSVNKERRLLDNLGCADLVFKGGFKASFKNLS